MHFFLPVLQSVGVVGRMPLRLCPELLSSLKGRLDKRRWKERRGSLVDDVTEEGGGNWRKRSREGQSELRQQDDKEDSSHLAFIFDCGAESSMVDGTPSLHSSCTPFKTAFLCSYPS